MVSRVTLSRVSQVGTVVTDYLEWTDRQEPLAPPESRDPLDHRAPAANDVARTVLSLFWEPLAIILARVYLTVHMLDKFEDTCQVQVFLL